LVGGPGTEGRRMKPKLCFLAAVALVVWGMKRHYAGARAEDLWWILSPTARLAGAITGTRFAFQPGEGFLSPERLFLIEKSCAGINFMIAAFGMSACVLSRRVGSGLSGACALGASLIASYAAAVPVNAVRITIAMWLAAHSLTPAGLSAGQIHRLEGIAVYFGGLVLLYELLQRFDRPAKAARVFPFSGLSLRVLCVLRGRSLSRI
jgi:exosortase K